MVDGHSLRFLPGTLVAGKFRIVRRIGIGGMGAVYEVLHEFTKHHRALKVLHPNYSRLPAIVTRFLREASAAGRIGSPHIVETFDAGRLESGEPYIVMELLAGRSLDSLLTEKERLGFDEAIEYIRQACRGLEAAHSAGIIHRDLKPENLFIEAGPFVKILDFGISKFDATLTGSEQLTRAGATLGTPFYMSPEQVRGTDSIDVRSDVYSLAAVLYECVTGNKPFSGATLEQLAVAIHVGNYAPVSRFRSDAPPGFADVLGAALASDRDLRYPSIRAFGDALAAFSSREAGWLARPTAPRRIDQAQAPSAVSHAPGRTAPYTQGEGTGSVSEPRKRSRHLLLSAVGALLLASLATLALWGQSDVASNGPKLVRESLPSASSPARDMRGADSDGPEVLSVVSSAADPTAAAPAPLPGDTSRVSTPQTKTSNDLQKPTRKTRATQHGLAEENPFGH